MSLIYCPECGHEISNAAVACPSCGRPVNARPVVEKRVVVADIPRESDGFPKWAFIPLGLLGAVLVLVFFVVMSRNNDDANSNLAVNVSARRTANGAYPTSAETQSVTVPPSSSAQTVTVPGESVPPPTSVTNIPGSSAAVTAPRSDKGTVMIDAKMMGQSGPPRAVKNERFYLLDKDVESILSDARIEPLDGQSLSNSLGLSVLFPGRYGDFNRQALRAIKEHIKYAGQTDGSGKAQLGGVEPNSYYLFGITKTGEGFAMWNSPVSVISGQNILNLSPQPITQMQNSPGE